MTRNPRGSEEARANMLADLLKDQSLFTPLLKGEMRVSDEESSRDKQALDRLKERDWLFV
jgi:hypothetical protein